MTLMSYPGSCPPNPCTPCQPTRSPPSAARCCRPQSQHPNNSQNPKHPQDPNSSQIPNIPTIPNGLPKSQTYSRSQLFSQTSSPSNPSRYLDCLHLWPTTQFLPQGGSDHPHDSEQLGPGSGSVSTGACHLWWQWSGGSEVTLVSVKV